MGSLIHGRSVSDAELLGRLLAGACEVDERLLAALLAEGVPAPVAVRRAVRTPWRSGAALILGGALAFGVIGDARAYESNGPAALPAVAAPARASTGGALAALPARVAEGAAPAAAPASLGDASLEAGLVLHIPALDAAAQQGTSPTSQLYTVQPGDTLSGIAQRFYGAGWYWPTIYNANAGIIANPHLIYPGQVFTIPATPAPFGTTTPGTVPGGTVTPGSQTGQGPGQYTVRPGDSLWTIAQFAYGNPYRWVDIYNANAAIIGANPSLIFAGTVLTIPA